MSHFWCDSPACRAALSFVLGALSCFAIGACTTPSFEHVDAGEPAKAGDDGPKSDDVDPDDQVDDTPTKPGRSTLDAGASCSEDSCASDARVTSGVEADASVSDAGTTEAGSAALIDASPNVNVMLDAVRSKWAGRYATRSYVFALDGAKTYASYLTVVEIKPTAEGGLVMEEQLCRFKSMFNNSVAGLAMHEVKYPASTRLSATLTYTSERFSSQTGSAKVGYGDAPADCAGQAMSSSSMPVRTWLVGNVCTCPTDLSVLPADVKDCRVYDQDNDTYPGTTYQASYQLGAFAPQSTVFRVAQEIKLRLVNAQRMGDRLFAQREFADFTKSFSCVTDGKQERPEIGDCPLGIVNPCPAELNPAELVQITAQQDCDYVIQKESTLFTTAEPDFPAACPVK